MIALRALATPGGALGALALLAAPLTAGIGAAGGWTIGFFALALVAAVLMGTEGAAWSSPLALAAVAAACGPVSAGLWLAGRGLSGWSGWAPGWGALPPLALAAAGCGLAVTSRRRA